jgi:hypothetical protein
MMVSNLPAANAFFFALGGFGPLLFHGAGFGRAVVGAGASAVDIRTVLPSLWAIALRASVERQSKDSGKLSAKPFR